MYQNLAYSVCPFCGSRDTYIDDGEVIEDAVPVRIRDRRQCLDCGEFFVEVYELVERVPDDW